MCGPCWESDEEEQEQKALFPGMSVSSQSVLASQANSSFNNRACTVPVTTTAQPGLNMQAPRTQTISTEISSDEQLPVPTSMNKVYVTSSEDVQDIINMDNEALSNFLTRWYNNPEEVVRFWSKLNRNDCRSMIAKLLHCGLDGGIPYNWSRMGPEDVDLFDHCDLRTFHAWMQLPLESVKHLFARHCQKKSLGPSLARPW